MPIVNQDRQLALRLAKGFNKFIALPDMRHWQVHQSDVLHRGSALSFLRTKSTFFLLPDIVSNLSVRRITITRHGYMVIYETSTTGLIVNIRDALNVFCSADKYEGRHQYSRCHVKIRMPRGNIHIFVKGDEIHKWTCAIMRATTASTYGINIPTAPLQKTSPSSEDVVVNTAISDDFVMTPQVATDDVFTPCYSDDTLVETDWELLSDLISPIPENIEERNTALSVRSLREKLEKELVIRTKDEVLAEQLKTSSSARPSFVSELFVKVEEDEDQNGTVFSDETTVVLEPIVKNEHEIEDEEKRKEWWMRSLRC